MKRIAVWNTAFLGDAVLTLPLIQTLADAFPLHNRLLSSFSKGAA